MKGKIREDGIFNKKINKTEKYILRIKVCKIINIVECLPRCNLHLGDIYLHFL